MSTPFTQPPCVPMHVDRWASAQVARDIHAVTSAGFEYGVGLAIDYDHANQRAVFRTIHGDDIYARVATYLGLPAAPAEPEEVERGIYTLLVALHENDYRARWVALHERYAEHDVIYYPPPTDPDFQRPVRASVKAIIPARAPGDENTAHIAFAPPYVGTRYTTLWHLELEGDVLANAAAHHARFVQGVQRDRGGER
jgi:hypothetical protein